MGCLSELLREQSPALLISVRCAAEAREAVAGGAHILDAKDPDAGPLGRSSVEARSQIAALGAPTRVVTAALGELRDDEDPQDFTPEAGVALYKLGLSGWGARCGWETRATAWQKRLAAAGAQLAPVAYADAKAAEAPPPGSVLRHAAVHRCPVVLVDTYVKKGTGLRSLLSESELRAFVRDAHAEGILVALAGSLGIEDVAAVLELGADVVAVRGAACRGSRRDASVERERVQTLASIVESFSSRIRRRA
jgi:uncharacterized protein (UPF0264 family)